MLTQEQIDFIYEDLIHAFDFLWFNVGDAHGIYAAQTDKESFAERKNDFLFLLGKLLDEGKLKLAKKGKFLSGTTTGLVEMFRKSFPDSDEAVDLGGAGIWFFTDECPAGAVWVFKQEGENEQEENNEDHYLWT